MRVKSAWITLELVETSTAAAENSFGSRNPTNHKAHNSFFQKNNFSNRCDKKPFSRTKRRNQIGRNGRRMKNDEDYCEHKEELAKRAK